MAKIVGIVSQKGGVGKTTTAVNLSASLALLGRKTLVVDFDPQGNSSSGLGIDKNGLETTVYDALTGGSGIGDSILKIYPDFFNDMLDASPSDSNLTGAEVELLSLENREHVLKNLLREISDRYSYIIIDCPPSLNILSVNALAASDSVIIPIQCEYYALEGLAHIKKTVSLIRRRINPALTIEGYLLTMFDTRNNICHAVARETRDHFGDGVFSVTDRKECPACGVSEPRQAAGGL